jgi:hypothetical protein
MRSTLLPFGPFGPFARLACQLEAWRPGPPLGDLCDRLVGSLGTQPQQDDMWALAVCRTP